MRAAGGYDLASDPTEQVNLADERPEKVAALRELTDRHLEGSRPPLYPSYLEAAIGVDKTKAERFGPEDEYVYWPN